MKTNKIKVVVTDDHEVLIDGLIALLAPEPDIEVIGKALNGYQLLKLLKTKNVDLIIMDIDMPELDGVEATKEVKQLYPNIKILILTMHGTPDFIKNLIQRGVDGYMLKYAPKRDLLKAIRAVAQNELFYTPDIAREVMKSLRTPSQNENQPVTILSNREIEIIKLVAQEYTSQEIADKLHLSFHTIERHRKNILAKLGLRNVAGLIRYAMRKGIIK
ncbi:MAG: response regulator transcription factor [Bacteroidota bacterium]